MIAMVSEIYPVTKVSVDQLEATRDVILGYIVAADQLDIRPCFRSCTLKFGYLHIAWANSITVS